MYQFEVLGEPIGKARPRVTRWGAYTPQKTVDYENKIKTAYTGGFYEGYLKIDVKAYFKIPKSTSKKKKESMLMGKIKPDKKPDIDNVLKIVLDSLNKIAYKDDAQVIKASITKEYSDTPRIKITISELEKSVEKKQI